MNAMTDSPKAQFVFDPIRNELAGWIPTAAEDGPRLAIMYGKTVVSIVRADAEPLSEAPEDVSCFRWPVPAILRADAQPRPVRVIDLTRGETITPWLVPPHAAEGGSLPESFGAEPERWPRGLAAPLHPFLNEIATGLYVEIAPQAAAPRFQRQDGPGGADEPGWCIRLTADAETPWVIHQRLPAAVAGLDGEERLRLWLKLARAVSNQTQCHAEIFLSVWDGERFERLRRLRRTRCLRILTCTDLQTVLEPEERITAGAGGLYLTVALAPCFGVVLGPVLPTSPPAGDARFEDGRLIGAFAHCAMLTRVGDEALGRELMMLDPPQQPTASRADSYPLTDIVVPIYNGADVILRCLRSVRQATDTPFRVWIIDDGSRGYTSLLLDQLVEEDSRFLLHRRAINRGYTKSINEAIKLSDADWLVILNSDTVVSRGWLRRLHDAARSVPGAGMVGPLSNAASWQSIPRAKNPDNTWSQNDFIEPELVEKVQGRLDAVSERAYPEAPVLNGFCTLIARAVFDTVGFFDEEAFPLGYGEETDMCLRAGLAGFRLVIADDCFVYHEKSVSFGSAKRSQLTRAGGFELKNKHPGVNVPAIERRMQFNPAMMRLRAKLVELETELDT